MENDIFIDNEHFNCPICHGMGCHYIVWGLVKFYTSEKKFKYALFVQCEGCRKISMHFLNNSSNIMVAYDKYNLEAIDQRQTFLKEFAASCMNVSELEVPFIMDCYNIERIKFQGDDYKEICESYVDSLICDLKVKAPKPVKENYLNIHRCLKQGLLVGASAYIRKTLEEIFVSEDIDIKNKKIDQMVDELKERYPSIDECITGAIKQAYHISSDTIHGNSQLEFDEQQIVVLQRCLELIMEEIAAKKDKAAKLKDLSSLSSQLGQKTSAKKQRVSQ